MEQGEGEVIFVVQEDIERPDPVTVVVTVEVITAPTVVAVIGEPTIRGNKNAILFMATSLI